MFGRSSSPREEGSSSPSHMGLPALVAPFRGRNRTLTEDTVLVSTSVNVSRYLKANLMTGGTSCGAESSSKPHPLDEGTDVDSKSLCSSLSEDSLRRYTNHHANEEEDMNGEKVVSPPQAIFVPVTVHESSSPCPPVWTGCESPALKRPMAPRQSESTLRTIKESFVRTPRSSPLSSASLSGTSTSRSLQILPPAKDRGLLGDRPRRLERRAVSATTTISVGSLVGQSSLVTSPTTSSLHSWMSPSVADDTVSFISQSARKKPIQKRIGGVVKDEIKYVLGRVATPIRRLKKAEQKADLKRADGCLT